MSYILLEGGSEFGGRMAVPDLRAIELAGGLGVPVAVLPTAAAPDQNHVRAGGNGRRWFQSLGAAQVEVVQVVDRASANDPALVSCLASARLIYLLGGFPRYLCETLRGSQAWRMVLEAQRAGAVIGGSSAGAMVLCEQYYDPDKARVLPGLDLLHKLCILPHHNRFGRSWAAKLKPSLAGFTLLGIDERTGLINDGPQSEWTVYGQGRATLYRGGGVEVYAPGKRLEL